MATANDRPGGNRIERRSFLTGLAALGSTAAVVATTAGASKAADLLHAATPATAPSGTPGPNVGKVENIRSEIKEFKDHQTGHSSGNSPATARITCIRTLIAWPSWETARTM